MRATAMQSADEKPLHLTRRIGSTTYRVSVHFSGVHKETMGEKITRLIQTEAEPKVPQIAATAGKRILP